MVGAYRSHRNGGLVIRFSGDGVKEGCAIDRRKRLGQCGGVPGRRGISPKFATYIEREPPGGRVAAGAGVVVKPIGVGSSIIVDDGRPEMKAVPQRRAADASHHDYMRTQRGRCP